MDKDLRGVELNGLCSNPSFQTMLERLTKAIGSMAPQSEIHSMSFVEPKPHPGIVLEAIKAVMAEHPKGLHVSEVKTRVEHALAADFQAGP